LTGAKTAFRPARRRETYPVNSPAEPEVVVAIRQGLERSDVVARVVLGGSRALGTATALSDRDLYLEDEPADLMAEIPALIASLQPLAAFWEPLSEQAGYMIIMDGPGKVDMFPSRGSRQIQPPWAPGRRHPRGYRCTFLGLDTLAGKSLRDEARLVADELGKMHWFLLGPSASPPVPRASATPSSRTG
jgi:hypothetical protein